MQRGRDDNTSMAVVSAMVYFTPAFKNIVTDPILYIEYLINGANEVFENSKVPVRLQEFCIEELDVKENSSSGRRLDEFLLAKSNLTVEEMSNDNTEDSTLMITKEKREDFILAIDSMLNTADIAILMMATNVHKAAGQNEAGAAYLGPTQIYEPRPRSPPLAWVSAGDEKGYPLHDPIHSFTHEVGHLFGCLHNRESHDGGLDNKTSYGFLVEGTKYFTTMAYNTYYHYVAIPYFSSKDVTYKGLPIGDAQNDNRKTLIENRFLLSEIGDELGTCSTLAPSCAGRCLRDREGIAPPYDEREIWCRYNCMMPMRRYYNLRGEAVGFGYVPLWDTVLIWLSVTAIVLYSVLRVCVTVSIQVVDLSYIPPEELWLCG